MAAQMSASLLGELVLLPAMLSCRPGRRVSVKQQVSIAETPATLTVDPEPVEVAEVGPEIHPFPAELPAVPRRIRAAR